MLVGEQMRWAVIAWNLVRQAVGWVWTASPTYDRDLIVQLRKEMDACTADRSKLWTEVIGLRETVGRLQLASLEAQISVDIDGKILDWNQAATTMFNWVKEEVLGRSILLLVPFEYRAAHEAAFARAVAGGPLKSGRLSTFALSREGRLVPVSIRVSRWTDDGMQRLGASMRYDQNPGVPNGPRWVEQAAQ